MSGERQPTERARLAVAGARAITVGSLTEGDRRKALRDAAFKSMLLIAVALALAALAALILQALVKGFPELDGDLFTKVNSSISADGGFRNAIAGTLWLIAGVIIFIVPLGVGAAVYLEEYAENERWFNRVVELNIQNLAAVPSIVYGILGLGLLVRGPLNLDTVILAGSATLALLVLPIVILVARESLRAVPPSIREGSLALGATKWQTIRLQVLPAAIPGIATGVILAISRAIGETAPLLIVGAAAFVNFVPGGPFDKYTALPVQIFNYASESKEEFRVLAAAGIIVLLGILLVLNSFAIALRNKYEQRW